jgi:hypothetical protein
MEQMDITRLRAAGADPDASLLGRLLTSLGYMHLRRWGKQGYQTCRLFYEQALQLAIASNDDRLIYKCEADLLSFAEDYNDLSPTDLEKMKADPRGTILHALASREIKLGNLAEAERLLRHVVADYGTNTLHLAFAEGQLSVVIMERLDSENNLTAQERSDRITEANRLYADSMKRRRPEATIDIAHGLGQRMGILHQVGYLREAAQLFGAMCRIDELRQNPYNQSEPFFIRLIEGSADAALVAAFHVGKTAAIEDSIQFAIDCGDLFYPYFTSKA